MAVTFGFYDSIDHDRQYTVEQFASMFDGLISDGIYMGIGDAFKVSPNSGMSIKVGSGRAWFNHTWTLNDADISLTIPEAPISGAGNRIDAVVIEVDKSVGVRANDIKVISGSPASTPQKPVMENTDTLKQYPLCYITVDSGTTVITDELIEDVRESEAGVVKAIVAVKASDYEVDQIIQRLDNCWTKDELQFSTADEGTTLNITVNETVSE